jgi:alpha-L-fucosidase 2
MKNLLRAVLFFMTALVTVSAVAAADLTLRYLRPAPDTHDGWEKEALPIGNGRIGAMIFGQPARERIQFNDITLWTGDDQVMGAYQPFGDVYINLPGHDRALGGYARELDIGRGVQQVSYTHAGVRFRREAFASHPAQVIAVRLSADKRGQYTGSIELTDMHDARIDVVGDRIVAVGTLRGQKSATPWITPARCGCSTRAASWPSTATGSPSPAAMPSR